MIQPQTKKIALVSGANRSIGKELARQLGKQDVMVLLGSRDLGAGEATADELRQDGADVTAIQLDVTSQTSVDTAVAHITKQYGRLDILVNNAGVGDYSEIDTVSLAVFESTYAVNVFGVVRLTEALLPVLKKSPDARIINVSSGLGSLERTQNPADSAYNLHLPAYNSSKTALNAITIQLAKFLQHDGIAINAVDPGFTATDLNGHTGTRSVAQSAEAIVWLALLPDSPTGKFFFDKKEAAW